MKHSFIYAAVDSSLVEGQSTWYVSLKWTELSHQSGWNKFHSYWCLTQHWQDSKSTCHVHCLFCIMTVFTQGVNHLSYLAHLYIMLTIITININSIWGRGNPPKIKEMVNQLRTLGDTVWLPGTTRLKWKIRTLSAKVKHHCYSCIIDKKC